MLTLSLSEVPTCLANALKVRKRKSRRHLILHYISYFHIITGERERERERERHRETQREKERERREREKEGDMHT